MDAHQSSHAVLRNGSRVCVVPLHEELAVGTLRGILRQAGITPLLFWLDPAVGLALLY